MRSLTFICFLAACASNPSASVDCGGAHCPGGQLCCFDANAAPSCAATCPAHTVTMLCDDPGDCGGGHCCMHSQLEATPNTLPNCNVTGTASCAADCQTSQPPGTGCTGALVDRLCTTSADCAGNGTSLNCCRGIYWSFCVSDAQKVKALQFGSTCS